MISPFKNVWSVLLFFQLLHIRELPSCWRCGSFMQVLRVHRVEVEDHFCYQSSVVPPLNPNFLMQFQFLSLFPIPSLLSLPNLAHPSRSSQSTRLSSLCYIATSHRLSILYRAVYIWMTFIFITQALNTYVHQWSVLHRNSPPAPTSQCLLRLVLDIWF